MINKPLQVGLLLFPQVTRPHRAGRSICSQQPLRRSSDLENAPSRKDRFRMVNSTHPNICNITGAGCDLHPRW